MDFYNVFFLPLIVMVLRDGVAVAKAVSPTNLTHWQKECFDQHNLYRNEHKVGRLQWSDSLKEVAEIWANYLGGSGVLSRGDKGENLYLTNGNQLPNCTRIVDEFYNEIGNYDYNNPGLSKNTERFSQIIWKNTMSVGVGFSKRKDGKYVVVFRYKPPGNYNTKTAYQQNVLPPPVKATGARLHGHQTIIITTVAMLVSSSF